MLPPRTSCSRSRRAITRACWPTEASSATSPEFCISGARSPRLRAGRLDKALLEELLAEPYFIPGRPPPALTQLQYFQEHEQRVALVVDEYGELLGSSRSRTSSRSSSASSRTAHADRAPRHSRGTADGSRARRGHQLAARAQPQARPRAAVRRPEDPERACSSSTCRTSPSPASA